MWLMMWACTQSIKDSGSQAGDADAFPETLYSVSVQIYDAFTGQALPEIEVLGNLSDESTSTDESGYATTEVNGRYHIEMSSDGYPTHHYMGQTEIDFELIALLANESTSTQVYTMLGITQNPNNGVLVVALDEEDLSPAVGASASIDANMSQAFVLGNTGPSYGTTVNSSMSSVVTFPDLPPGEVTITAINATGENCFSFPSGDGSPQAVSIFGGAVTVAVYTCQ